MGCFSYICQKSGEPINSSSFSGDACYLFLLKEGKVIEMMYGNYDSYGRVFDSQDDSFEWKMDWHDICDLQFGSNPSSGIAAIKAKYWKEGDDYPKERSKHDPNQGWGEHGELMGSISTEIGQTVENPYHKVII